ncbi:hypothetical protein T02_6031 [Trichinella nativa]|uniref:Uncharacterized protein n=1 Tax=Trichinella nativa TaxID=6335 RepID=A0A0V1LT70_9BILA|nr:hypothetical protein T02_6031 [Trichinella nativa]
MFVKLPSGRGEHDQMENRERSTVNLRSLLADKKADRRQTAEAVPENRSRSGVVGQGSLDHHVGRGGKFPILTNGSGISIAPMIDRSAACAAAGCSVEQEGCESILQARKLYNVKADVVGQLLCNCKTAKLPPTLISPACFSRKALERK